MKTLIIAEKPSVAADLARALGKVAKKSDHFENDDYVISSAVGHVVELEMPEDIDKKKYGFWRLETLPIIPEKFGLKPVPSSKDRFDALKKLLARKDVGEVINACDAGREGELIFTYLCQLAKNKLPVKRAWMQTMTAEGIREAFRNLRDGGQMAGLADAARCRSESDWLIGINGTRAITKRMFGSRAGNVASVGRVQTPTLAIVVARELEIRHFQPRAYWRVTATFQIAAGNYEGVYQRAHFRKAEGDEHDRIDRIWDKALAEAVAAACAGQPPAAVREEKKGATQIAPRLYDLTTLQREANNRFGLSARRTLQIAQALYERHKMITYPRTDSRALPEDYIPTVRQTLGHLGGDLAAHAHRVLEEGWVHPNKRIFNNAQISDHFAIIPTGADSKHLEEMEAKVYDMIARRFVAVFFPAAEFDVTTRISTVAPGHDFKTEGKVLTVPGWLAVYGRTTVDDGERDARALPAMSEADRGQAKTLEAKLLSEMTKPPPRYTEATLLSAMEGAGKLVEDEELAEAMKERGLGTPATRADIIDGLILQKYLERAQRELVPTAKAEQLLEFLAAVKAEALTKPDMTGEWEYKLRQMEQGKFPRPKFMAEIVEVTKGIVDRTKNFEEDDHTQRECSWLSPTDHKPMLETLRAFKSQDGELVIYKVTGGRKLSEDEVRALIEHGEIGPFSDFRSPRTGKTYTASLHLEPHEERGGWKVRINLPQGEDPATMPVVWTNPKTGEELCEGGAGYALRKAGGASEEDVVFRVGRMICRKELPREQVIKLVAEGKTDPIEGFISKKGRPFKAMLLRNGAKIGWEFPPREKTERKPGAKPGRAPRKEVDLSAAKVIGHSKAHDGELLATEDAFVVRKPDGANGGRVVFKMSRKICSREMEVEDVQRLLETGRTGLITDFISKRGSPFGAYLVLSDDKSKANFEFPPR